MCITLLVLGLQLPRFVTVALSLPSTMPECSAGLQRQGPWLRVLSDSSSPTSTPSVTLGPTQGPCHDALHSPH
ncbi:hypothetical protein LIA77_04358 [Sarocladium implicatum]|nr:hypothetical protein LIA77_04358 [Sarocladium implicatum]